MLKGITTKKVEVKNQPLEADEYVIGELASGTEVEIDVKDFGFYMIKFEAGYAYVKEEGIKEV